MSRFCGGSCTTVPGCLHLYTHNVKVASAMWLEAVPSVFLMIGISPKYPVLNPCCMSTMAKTTAALIFWDENAWNRSRPPLYKCDPARLHCVHFSDPCLQSLLWPAFIPLFTGNKRLFNVCRVMEVKVADSASLTGRDDLKLSDIHPEFEELIVGKKVKTSYGGGNPQVSK